MCGEIARTRQEEIQAQREVELYEQIGRLKMELEWLKKKLPKSIATKRQMIEPDHPMISIRRQCQLIGLPRSSYYYKYKAAPESELNLQLMKAIDQLYLCYPFYGYRTMTTHLRRDGWPVNHKRVQRSW